MTTSKLSVFRCFQQVAAGGGLDGRASWIVLQAECMLGWCYNSGEGVDKDETEAVTWYRKAAGQGHSNEKYNLGCC